jgi:hypothetical protein
MALELENAIVTVKSTVPKKKSKKDDAPLIIYMGLTFTLPAAEVLPYFHPNLRHFLYCETGLRFEPYLKSIAWDEQNLNMEIEIIGQTIQAEKVHKFIFNPFVNEGAKELDERDMISVNCEAVLMVSESHSPLNLLSELINTETEISMHPSQLSLDELKLVKKED